MNWKDLSIRDRAAIIRRSVSDGIYNLGEIRNRFDRGGNIFSGEDNNQPTQQMQMWGMMPYEPSVNNPFLSPVVDFNNRLERLNDVPKMMVNADIIDGRMHGTYTQDEKSWAEEYPDAQYFTDKYSDFVSKRRDVDETNLIPYLDSKRIKLTNAGKSTGATLSTNLLDSLAKYGALTNTHPYDMVGLPARETEFGAYPGKFLVVDNKGFTPKEYTYHGQNKFVDEGVISPAELINNDKYFASPYSEAIAWAARKSGGLTSVAGDSRVYYLGYPATDSLYNAILKGGRNYADRQALKINMNEHPLVHGFNLFNSGKFNTGEAGYNDRVRKDGMNVFNSPEVKDWWNSGGRGWYIGTQYEDFNP